MSKSREPEPSSLKTPNQGTHLPTLVHAIGHCAHFGAYLEFQACSTGLHLQIPHRHLLGLVRWQPLYKGFSAICHTQCFLGAAPFVAS
jgi:hypothetical protein